jgi:hypothetical protein
LKGYAELRIPDKPEKSIEDRISDIVRNLDNLREGQGNNYRAIDKLKEEHENFKKVSAEQTE